MKKRKKRRTKHKNAYMYYFFNGQFSSFGGIHMSSNGQFSSFGGVHMSSEWRNTKFVLKCNIYHISSCIHLKVLILVTVAC